MIAQLAYRRCAPGTGRCNVGISTVVAYDDERFVTDRVRHLRHRCTRLRTMAESGRRVYNPGDAGQYDLMQKAEGEVHEKNIATVQCGVPVGKCVDGARKFRISQQ
jgi:hypothetical protein